MAAIYVFHLVCRRIGETKSWPTFLYAGEYSYRFLIDAYLTNLRSHKLINTYNRMLIRSQRLNTIWWHWRLISSSNNNAVVWSNNFDHIFVLKSSFVCQSFEFIWGDLFHMFPFAYARERTTLTWKKNINRSVNLHVNIQKTRRKKTSKFTRVHNTNISFRKSRI